MSNSPALFFAGDMVEVMSQDEGFEGSMFEARIVESQSNRNLFLIEYETLVDDAVPAKNLLETIGRAHIRPRPPRGDASGFKIGEKVDALYNDGWWVGEISKVLEGGKRYVVKFTVGGDEEETEFGFEEIRVHLDWIDGEWIGQKFSLEDKFAVSQSLCEIEPDGLKQLMQTISIVHESQIPLWSSTVSCHNDGNSCKLLHSAANLGGINSEESMVNVHLESSQPCKKLKNGEAIQDNVEFNCLPLARGVKAPCIVETGFKVAAPLTEETSKLHLGSLTSHPHCARGPNNENRLSKPDIVTNTVSNTLFEANGKLTIQDYISQQLVQHKPFTDEPSILKGEFDKLGDMGSVNKPKLVNLDQRTNHYLVKDVQQTIKKVVAVPRHGCKGLGQLVTDEKRTIKRERPREEKMADTAVDKEGIELKQLEKQQDLVVRRSNSLKQYVRKRRTVGYTNGDVFGEIQRETDNQDTGEAKEPSNGGNCTSYVEKVTSELLDISEGSNVLVQPCDDRKEAQDKAFLLSGSQGSKRIEIKDRTEAYRASNVEPHDDAGGLPVGDQEAEGTEGESNRILTDHMSMETYLPFAKASPMWRVVESSELYATMQQKPHFLPLKRLSEESREGAAIGLMVTYTNLVDSIKKLGTTDTGHTLQGMTEALTDLERHGFNVQHLRDLLKEFQAMKGKQKWLSDKKSELKALILERQHKKDELDAKFELIDSVVVRLERSLTYFADEKASLLKRREGNDHEIGKLQDDLRSIEESSIAAGRSFLNTLNSVPGNFGDRGY